MTQLCFFAIFSNFITDSLLQTPPVGFEGELIMTPLMFGFCFLFKSSKSGSKFFSAKVSTSKGSASASLTNSGKETQ